MRRAETEEKVKNEEKFTETKEVKTEGEVRAGVKY